MLGGKIAKILKRMSNRQILMRCLLDLFCLMLRLLLWSFAKGLSWDLNIIGENYDGYRVEGAVLSDLNFGPLSPILETLDAFFE